MTTVSEVSISNLAMQLLGAKRIVSLTEDSRNARACNNCYEILRDAELEAHPWGFAVQRAVLAPDVTAPLFDYLYAFTWPSDALRILPPRRYPLDWLMEGRKILTNDGNTLQVRYLKRITDPAQFHSTFVLALAARMANHMCEEITQSNQKKADAEKAYKEAIAMARKMNAFAKTAVEDIEDPWVSVRL